jgi:hypothetical protein
LNGAAYSYVPLAEGWNGNSWTIQSTTNPGTGALSGVSCTTPTACTATVIGFNQALAERWDGTSWTLQAAPGSPFNGVSCTSATACTAVGEGDDGTFLPGTQAEAWDGTSWTIQPTPNPSGASSLSGVSCTSATACTAVGYSNNGSTDLPLAERWDGSTWAIQTTPTPSGATDSSLSGVSCSSATECTAVGSYDDSSGVQVALVERWDGSTWTIQNTPIPSGATGSSLSAVSCTSATACTAVGSYTNSAGTQLALVERYTG